MAPSERTAYSSFSGAWAVAATPRTLAIFLSIWAAVILFGGLQSGDLSGYDDAVYAHEAREMLRSGDIWTLSLNGQPDFDKPPLFIWLVALSFKIFGTNDPAAKIPGAVCGFGAILLVYLLAAELGREDGDELSEWTPAVAMLSIATTQYFLKYSTHAMTDVPFAFLFLLAIYGYVRSWRSRRSGEWMLAAGVATGLAMLTRAPVGLFPIAIVALHLIYSKRARGPALAHFAVYFLISLSIPLVWYAIEFSIFGNAFIEQHLRNVVAHSASKTERTALDSFFGLFEYPALLAKLYWPWIPLVCVGSVIAIRKAIDSRDAAAGLLLIWVLAVMVPLSFADAKVLRYIMAAFPAFAILAAWGVIKMMPARWLPASSRALILILAIVGMVSLVSPTFTLRAVDMKAIAPISDAAARPDERVVLYTSGELQWNFANQLLWYGNRYCTHIKDLADIRRMAADGGGFVLIIDKDSYARLSSSVKEPMVILGESPKFYCVRIGWPSLVQHS